LTSSGMASDGVGNRVLGCMRQSILVARLLTIPLISLFLGGCASVFNSGPEQVQIGSTPNAARVTIYDEHGDVVASGRTLFKAELKAGGKFKPKSYRVKLEKLGYQSHEFIIENKLSDWYWGNLFYSGPIGALVVDPMTGNMWKLDPKRVEIQLEKIRVPASESSLGLPILTVNQVNPSDLSALKPLSDNCLSNPCNSPEGTTR
jgi:hypothetical protein